MTPDFAYAAQNPNYGMVGGQTTAFAEGPPSTSVSKASDAMARAADVCLRIEALADRLCGSVPTAVNTAGNQIKGKGPGVLPQLEGHASELEDFVARAHGALTRIDSNI